MPLANASAKVLTAVAQPTPLPPGMVTTPLDWVPLPVPIIGVPIWFIIAILLFGCLILTITNWHGKSAKLNSVKGWAESLGQITQNKVQVWIISRVQKLTIECLDIKDNILSYPNEFETKIGMWHINSSMGVVRVAGSPAVIISEDYDQNRDILTEIALCHGCDFVNANLDELWKKLNERYQKLIGDGVIQREEIFNPAELVKPIVDCDSYEATGQTLLMQLFPDGIVIPAYNIFNSDRFRKYFPRGCSAMFFGGELIRDAEKLNTNVKEKNFLEKYMLAIIAAVVAIVFVGVAYFLPFGKV